ncbi:reverse transcriptase domain-containing protein [Tanacetum coccineum]
MEMMVTTEMVGEMETKIEMEMEEAMRMEILMGMIEVLCMSPRELTKLMTKVYCPKNEIQKMETELWNLTVKGLPDNIQRNVIVVEPTRLQDAIRIANNLMDHKLKGYAARSNVARAYTAGNNERRGYAGPWPYCNKCKLHHEGPCTVKCRNCNKVRHTTRDCKNAFAAIATQRVSVVNQRVGTCFECGRQGHYKKKCPKLRNQNRGNKSGSTEAKGKAYAIGGGDANLDFNVVTGTVLLNNRYASILFDLGADRSFVSTTFSALLDVIPSTLDVSYAVELANGRVAETNTVLRGCTLGLLGQPFNINLIPVELGSFEVIIGMDWLANHHAVIVCDE